MRKPELRAIGLNWGTPAPAGQQTDGSRVDKKDQTGCWQGWIIQALGVSTLTLIWDTNVLLAYDLEVCFGEPF